ncbi:hypothetical protein D3C75_281310 [compost metagenome]
MGFSLMLRLQVINRHDVQIPTAQLRSQTYVLTVTTDSLCQITRFNGDIHCVLIFVHDDRRHISRSHRVDHELRRVIVPQNDIDAFAAQLSRNGLDTCATHTNASTNRVDTLVVSFYRDLSARTRIAGRCFDLDNFFTDFWHLNAEQFDQHLWLRASDEQLRTARFWTHCVQNTADTVARAEVFTRQHIFTQDNGFSIAAQIQRDVVAVNFLHHTGDDFTFVFAELINHHRALSFTYFLYDNLLSGLGSDTVEGDRFDLIFYIFANVEAFVFITSRFKRDFFSRLGHFFNNHPTAEGIEVTTFTIDFYANIDLLFVFFLGCCRQCTFQRFENLLTRQ